MRECVIMSSNVAQRKTAKIKENMVKVLTK